MVAKTCLEDRVAYQALHVVQQVLVVQALLSVQEFQLVHPVHEVQVVPEVQTVQVIHEVHQVQADQAVHPDHVLLVYHLVQVLHGDQQVLLVQQVQQGPVNKRRLKIIITICFSYNINHFPNYCLILFPIVYVPFKVLIFQQFEVYFQCVTATLKATLEYKLLPFFQSNCYTI